MIERQPWKIHPGEILREEFLVPMGLTAYALAKSLRVPPIRINDIVNEKRSISVNTALRLAKFFGNTPQFWLNLQSKYDMQQVLQEYDCELELIEAYDPNDTPTRH
ncbi:MAG: HigA family addiction module antitoxin [Pseudomonadota bacterium]